MNILHIVPGLEEQANGIAVAAKLIAGEQGANMIDAREFTACGNADLEKYDECWIHSCWLPSVLKSCWKVVRSGRPLVCMTHANLDPVRLRYHGWKKWLAGPIERWCLRRCDRIVATCEAEKGWIQSYLGKRCPAVEVTDVKRFFNLNYEEKEPRNILNTRNSKLLHLMYLGRRHPLKGLEYLEEAVRQLNSNPPSVSSVYSVVQLKIVSNAFGEEKEKVWEWCDVLVLPTLSENFGLVIAEALERGKCVITTDGAPAWGDGLTGLTGFTGLYTGYDGRLIYLKGYREGTHEARVALLRDAIEFYARCRRG